MILLMIKRGDYMTNKSVYELYSKLMEDENIRIS